MLSSTSAVIDKSPYFVRTSCTLAQSSVIIADWAIKNGIKKVVTLVSDFSPGHEAEATFKGRYMRPVARSRKPSACRCKTRTFRHSSSAPAMPAPGHVCLRPFRAGRHLARQFVERGLDKAGIRLIGPGDITDDELLPSMGDVMLGTITAHFYSAAHPPPMNKAFVDATGSKPASAQTSWR